jgi:hypothetical protein
MAMAKCTECGADITSTGYDTEELKLPNDSTGYVVSLFPILSVKLLPVWSGNSLPCRHLNAEPFV